jgi:hypothetical protein
LNFHSPNKYLGVIAAKTTSEAGICFCEIYFRGPDNSIVNPCLIGKRDLTDGVMKGLAPTLQVWCRPILVPLFLGKGSFSASYMGECLKKGGDFVGIQDEFQRKEKEG